MRLGLAFAALLIATGCAAPKLHPSALEPGQKVGEQRIEGDPNAAHVVYFAPTLSTKQEHLKEREVDVEGYRVLVRSAWAVTGFAYINPDGSSLGHGHGEVSFFEAMSARPEQPLPDNDIELLFAIYHAACILPDDIDVTLAEYIEQNPGAIEGLRLKMESGGYYRVRVLCEFKPNLRVVRR